MAMTCRHFKRDGDALRHIQKCQPEAKLFGSVQIGYYFSAFTVDKTWMGRVRLQSMVSIQIL